MPTKQKPPADPYIFHMYRALAMSGLIGQLAPTIMNASKEESQKMQRAIRRVATEQADEMVRTAE